MRPAVTHESRLVDEATQRLAVLGERAASSEAPYLLDEALRYVVSFLQDVERATALECREETVAAAGRLVRRLVPRWHFAMLNDDDRGRAFESALAAQVRSHHTVLDIGTGSGLLAMMAARAGAKRVITCERSPVVADVARKVIAANGLGDTIEVFAVGSDELDVDAIGGSVDLVISETVDCGLFGEGVLPTIRHARRELLAPDGIVIPAVARVTAMLVMSDAIAALNRVDRSCDFDVGGFNALATNGYFPVRLGLHPYAALSERVQVLELDFRFGDLVPSESVQDFPVVRDGICHGVAFWFELLLTPDDRLENSPENPGSHWHQAVQLFAEPIEVEGGTDVAITVGYDDATLCFTPLPVTRDGSAGQEGRPRHQVEAGDIVVTWERGDVPDGRELRTGG